ncbi:MAG: hypothetical protein AAGF47_03130 [Planctomycetota bacterium]
MGEPGGLKNGPEIAACVLLAGGLIPSPLVEQARRPVLDLWLTARQTVFGRWCDVLFDSTCHGSQLGGSRPMIHVVHSGPPFAPATDYSDPRFEVLTQEEPGSFRGPAGVLRDVTGGYGPDDVILVAEAARYMAGTLGQLLDDWERTRCDALIACHPDGRPTGIMLIRRGTLELVPPVGYMDIKEQWLPALQRAGLTLWTSETRDFQPFPLRKRSQFLEASAIASGVGGPGSAASVVGPPRLLRGPLDRARVAESATVAEGAVVVDAVVMPGAQIGDGAVVVRSVVCADAVVPAGSRVIEEVVPCAA